MKVTLHNINTAVEWQCAHTAYEEAVQDRQGVMEFEGPGGDVVKLNVEHVGKRVRHVIIRRVR